MTPRSSSEELRTRAVEAARRAAHEAIDDDETTNVVASRALAAAEPFIRELVVAQVVEWLRGDDAETTRIHAIDVGIPPEDMLASEVEHKFGGSR